ncbi:N-acetylmuramoyl-L-alanine amidase [Peribacillus frigoritolerans]|uniref:N-acetylmuramoyl-L-alanine amidase n=1 Tax=Peribacillus frigoritolerans TaxID=450367 RepID=UPI0032B5EDE1
MSNHKLCLSYGHGSDTFKVKGSKGIKVNGKAYEEHTHNAQVGVKVKKIVEAHGVKVLEVQPPFGKDVPLSTRTNKANNWDADLYYSIHSNAADPKTRGYAAFYWSKSAAGKRIAEDYAKYAKEEGFPLYHNGVYPSVQGTWNDFHELRETKMPAILTENGFMTNKDDFKMIFQDENILDKEAKVHAKTILEFFKIKYDPTKAGEKKPEKPEPADTLFKVQVGAFGSRENAERLVAKLKKDGYPAVITK